MDERLFNVIEGGGAGEETTPDVVQPQPEQPQPEQAADRLPTEEEAEAMRSELTTEERFNIIDQAILDIYQRINITLGLLAALGELGGNKLKTRQVDGGLQFYWDAAGRIVLPGRM